MLEKSVLVVWSSTIFSLTVNMDPDTRIECSIHTNMSYKNRGLIGKPKMAFVHRNKILDEKMLCVDKIDGTF